jgi:hypothetical protein
MVQVPGGEGEGAGRTAGAVTNCCAAWVAIDKEKETGAQR